MNTQERIIKTTIDIIDKSGYENLSLRTLTKDLGLTTGAFYKHFESKEKLFEEVAIKLSKDFVNNISLNLKDSPKIGLLKIAKYFCLYVTEHSNLADFLFFNSTVVNSYLVNSGQYKLLTEMKKIISQINKEKNISDQDLFIQIWSFIQGYAVLIKNKTVNYNEELVEQTLNEFLS